MPAEDALLFIDANKYLDLYKMAQGRKLLAILTDQADNIFVPRQIVEEVQRNTVNVFATQFLQEQLGKLELQTCAVPDHLFGADEGMNKAIRREMEEIDNSR